MTDTIAETTYCANHPNVETHLHCQRCDKLICIKCAVHTPTGYKCRECVRGQQKVFETAQLIDYPIAFIVAGILGYISGLIAGYLGFFVFFIAPLAGGIMAEGVRLATRRHRARNLFLLALAGAVIGSLLPGLGELVLSLVYPELRGSLFGFIWRGVFTVLMASTFYYRLSGLQLGR